MAEGKRKPNELLRTARGSMTQAALADQLSAEIYRATGRVAEISSKSISDWERGWYSQPRKYVRDALRKVLQVQTDEDLGFRKPRRSTAPQAAIDLLALTEPRMAKNAVERLSVPSGRSYAGVELAAHYCDVNQAVGEMLLVEPEDETLAGLSRPDCRPLVVAVDEDRRSYVADGRRFLDRAGRRTGAQALPLANVIDDLTVGIIWATANLDTSLLADDAQLVRSQSYVADYETMSSSRGTSDELPALNAVAAQWLGSQFCSRHISRHLNQLEGPPFFWTRERRGEEAATWLLWSHKFEYLRLTARRFSGMRRGFCIPEADVAASPRYERVILLLAMALMEAFRIRVELSEEPELTGVEGFVLSNQAIVANWLGGAELWYVNATTSRERQATYRMVEGQVVADSLTPQASPQGRLMALADYLNVPWDWFRRRCSELAAVGVDDIAHPRSRLLSTRGLNCAIRYVAYIDVLEGDDLARC